MANRPRGGLYALVQPSPALAAIVGARPLPRFEVTRRIWRYIKKHRLQDPHNGRIIRPDGALKRALGGLRRVDMMEMTRLLSGQVKAHAPARRAPAARRGPAARRPPTARRDPSSQRDHDLRPGEAVDIYHVHTWHPGYQVVSAGSGFVTVRSIYTGSTLRLVRKEVRRRGSR